MPILDTMIPETTKQIIEPVSTQIVQRLLSTLGVWKMFKNNLHITADNLKTGNFDSANDNQRMIENRCNVSITPNFNPLAPAMEVLSGKDIEVHSTTKRWLGGALGEYPIFSDARPNIYLYEMDTPCSVELEFELRAKSLEASDLINVSIYSKSLTGGSVYDFSEVLYHYPIPDRMIMLLYRAYKLQTSINEHITFQQYLTAGSNDKIRVLLNRDQLDDGNKQLVIERMHSGILGKLEYDGAKPEAESTNKVVERYLTNFKYTFQFGKPTLLKIEYPIMINNTMIGAKYIKRPPSMSVGEVTQHHPTQAINKYFKRYNELLKLEDSYPAVRYPDYDEWLVSPAMYQDLYTKYLPRFIGLMSIDISSTGSLSLSVNLRTEIFPLLDPKTVAAIEAALLINYDESRFQAKQDIFRRLGIFDIAVFANDNMVDFNNIHLSDDLILTVSAVLNVEKRYRVVISQIREVRILNQFYIYYMLSNPEYYYDFLAFHLNYLVETNYLCIKTDELTNGVSVHRQPKYQQRYDYHPGPNPAITLGRYIVEVKQPRP